MGNNLWVSVVLLAAGSGRRFGAPKQFVRLQGHPLIHWPLATLTNVPSVKEIVLVVSAEKAAWAKGWVRRRKFQKVRAIVPGGKERADSVKRGIAAVDVRADVVLIHDGARPLVTGDVVERVAHAAHRSGAALAARRVPDTLKRARWEDGRWRVEKTVSRQNLWAAQTPQGFRADVLRRVARRLTSSITDDVQAAERSGVSVELVEGAAQNFKVTLPEDRDLCERIMEA